MQIERNKILNLTEKTLSSELFAAFFMLFGMVCWFFELSLVCITAFSVAFICIFIFCKDIKNAFALLLFLPFFLVNNTLESGVWGIYVACIACCATAVVGFTITQIILNKNKIRRGKLFFPLFLFAATLLIGGVTRFNVSAFAAFLAASIVIIALYFIAVNFTVNFTDYLAKLLVFGAIVLTLEILITHLRWPDFIESIKTNPNYFFSSESMNTASIMITLGIVGLYKFGIGKKKDYLYLLLSLCFVGGVLITKCRFMTVIAALVWLFAYVDFFIKTPNKKLFTWATIIAVLAILGVAVVFRKKLIDLITEFATKGQKGANGRDELWPWCIEKFLKFPVFGYGYLTEVGDSTYKEKVDIVNMILAHNTMLQWITCSGIVGGAL
ncbi:MAG: O-antigen ligase family protein, partial [Clostridia bacterium]|nr:O-antigen ligase family protein [Clostridia bacterium]